MRRHGFTMIEVLMATALLGVVGAGIAGFLSAMASGTSARGRVSDPALEGAIAMRRFEAFAPSARCVLEFRHDAAAVWLHDDLPSRTVHTSEIGWLRFDEAHGEIVFERLDPAALALDRSLETEHDADSDFMALLGSLRRANALRTTVLSEGLDRVNFHETAAPTRATVELSAGGARATVALATLGEEPLR
ncbi:MAG: type II secretion system protein J [Planctomycetota bacterium]